MSSESHSISSLLNDLVQLEIGTSEVAPKLLDSYLKRRGDYARFARSNLTRRVEPPVPHATIVVYGTSVNFTVPVTATGTSRAPGFLRRHLILLIAGSKLSAGPSSPADGRSVGEATGCDDSAREIL